MVVRDVLRLIEPMRMEVGEVSNFIFKNSCLSDGRSTQLFIDMLEDGIFDIDETGETVLSIKGRALQKKKLIPKINKKKAQSIVVELENRATGTSWARCLFSLRTGVTRRDRNTEIYWIRVCPYMTP